MPNKNSVDYNYNYYINIYNSDQRSDLSGNISESTMLREQFREQFIGICLYYNNLVGSTQLPAEEHKCRNSENNEDQHQSNNVNAEILVQHVEFFQRCLGVLEVAVDL